MTKVTTSLTAKIEKGPQITIPPIELEIDSYEKIEVSLSPANKVSIEVNRETSKVVFILITASDYSPLGEENETLEFTINEKKILLQAPQLYLGESMISQILGDTKIIEFTNNSVDKDKSSSVDIVMLVGRTVEEKAQPEQGS